MSNLNELVEEIVIIAARLRNELSGDQSICGRCCDNIVFKNKYWTDDLNSINCTIDNDDHYPGYVDQDVVIELQEQLLNKILGKV